MGEMITAQVRQRLLSNYIPVPFSGCWLWLGGMDKKKDGGYGWITTPAGNRRPHRLMLMLATGLEETDLLACHRCDVRLCINPDHLFWGTQADNVLDASAKGRLRNQNSDKTHCDKGHEFTPDNTGQQGGPYGGRKCLACNRVVQTRYYERHREEVNLRARERYRRKMERVL